MKTFETTGTSNMAKALQANDRWRAKRKRRIRGYLPSTKQSRRRSMKILLSTLVTMLIISLFTSPTSLSNVLGRNISQNTHSAGIVPPPETVANVSFLADQIAIIAIPVAIIIVAYVALSIGQIRGFMSSKD